MPLFVKARSFLRNLFLSRRVEVDLDQEVHAHLEMLTEENIRLPLRSPPTPQKPGLHCRRRPHPGSRHRRQHGHLLRCRCRPLAALAVRSPVASHCHP